MAIYLIDGNSYVYRAFYAIRGLTTSAGRPVNAVYGFTTMLMKIIRERRPEAVIVSFDTPHPTQRHEMYAQYKAHRPETPAELIEQLPMVKRVVSAMNIRDVEAPGYEADDVIATIAAEARRRGKEVFIVTGDKDMLQLVGEGVRVYDPMKDREMGVEEVVERFGVPPERVPEYIALAGDAADNIPGVKGIGDKTAKELLAAFADLEDLMAHPERIGRERLRRMIEEGADNISLSLRLAVIRRDVPLELEDRDFALREPDYSALAAIFKEMEFSSLMRLIPSQAAPPEGEFEAVTELGRLRAVAAEVGGELSLDTETTGLDPLASEIVGFSLSWERGMACYVPLGHHYLGVPGQIPLEEALGAVRPVLEDERISKVGHNLKFDILVLRGRGVELKGKLFDTMVASYLLNPSRTEHSLESVGLERLGIRKRPFREVVGVRKDFSAVEVEAATAYAAADAALPLQMKDALFEELAAEGLDSLYHEVEMPLIRVLADMEAAGMLIDVGRLRSIGKELEREIDALAKRIYFIAGSEFNINSPRQLGRVLFEDLGLRPRRKGKTGYSTDVGVLEELAQEHDLPREILNYRSLTKLKNTYVDVLPELINPRTGRLHTSFNQAVAATGRLSSSEPNLQNIPVRGEWGGRIREAFIARPGCVLVSADYSQIELRVLAHLSQDPVLLEAFRTGLDVHSSTAAEIFGVPTGKVDAEMRRVAKTVNFGVIYGMSPFGLSEALGIPRDRASDFIKRYFERHSGVEAYIERVIKETKKNGFVRTIMGRKRPVPELRSGNANTRLLGERLAVNSTVQGSAADIIKVAMINLARVLKGEPAAMLLQVHDELLFEVEASALERITAIIREKMEHAVELDVPVTVDIGSGDNWAQAH